MKIKNKILEVIISLFIFLFVYTAISKLIDIPQFERAIDKSPFLNQYTTLVIYTIPVLEILISVLLAFKKTRKIGIYSATILMLIFTGYLIFMLSSTTDLPCACGGVISLLNWKTHVWFNMIFIILGITGIILVRNDGAINSKRSQEYLDTSTV